MAGAVRRDRVRRVPLSTVREHLGRLLHDAARQEIVITRRGRPVGMLIGFVSGEDLSDRQLENDPRFLQRIATARESLRAGHGVRLEDLDLDE